MRLLDLLRRESTVSLRGLTIMAMLAGISSALVLPIINTAAVGGNASLLSLDSDD